MQQWEDFLEKLESKMGSSTIKKWISPLKILQFDARNLYLEAEDSFQVAWFEEHIRPLLKEFVNSNYHPIQVHLKSKTSQEKKKETFFQSSLSIEETPLDPNATFSLFYPSETNHLSYDILEEFLKSPFPPSFNPLFLHGPSSSGKTHLLMASAQLLKEKGFSVFFVNAQQFTDHLVQSIRLGKVQEFREKYRTPQVLILDDIQIFSKKNATQEEFFHTFNTLHTEGHLIILSANVPPSKLSFIEPRLISRFEWGLLLSLEKLPKNSVRKILEKKISFLELQIDQTGLDFLLEKFSSNLKSLQKVFEALLLRCHINRSHSLLTPDLLKIHLKDLLEEAFTLQITSEKIFKEVCAHFGIRLSDLLGKAQTRDCVLPRQIAMYLCRTKLKMVFTQIGSCFEKDHSTVMTSIKNIEKALLEKNKEVSTALSEISSHLEPI